MVSRVQFLKNNLHGFDQEKPRNQRFVDVLLFSRNNRHWVFPEAKSFSRPFLRNMGIPGNETKFKEVNNRLDLFYTTGSYKPGVFSQPWWLTDHTRDVIVQFALQGDIGDLMQKCETIGIPLNITDVRDFMFTEATPEQVLECSYLISAVEEGTLDNEYKKLPCGREVAIGQYSIQHMPRWLRKIALKGWWDYDFRNCHYTIASTLGDFPSINHYVENTEEVRDRLVSVTGCSKDNVKMALLSKLYGAKNNSSSFCAIGQYLGKGGAERFFDDWFVKSLSEDIERLKPILIKKAERNALEGTSESKCAQTMMMYESVMLDLALKGVDKPIKMFDGFISPQRQEKSEIQRKLRQQMHIPVEVTEEQIG